MVSRLARVLFFFFNETATTEIYTLSLHDALPIYQRPVTIKADHVRRLCASLVIIAVAGEMRGGFDGQQQAGLAVVAHIADRKSTRLNSSHMSISYAVFCLKKKKKQNNSENTKRDK